MADILEMRYQGEDISMLILLPKFEMTTSRTSSSSPGAPFSPETLSALTALTSSLASSLPSQYSSSFPQLDQLFKNLNFSDVKYTNVSNSSSSGLVITASASYYAVSRTIPIETVLEKLTPENLKSVLNGLLLPQQVEVSLPRFELEQAIELKPVSYSK